MKGNRKIGLGLVGCSWVVRDLYGPAFEYLKNGELVAVMDIKEENAKTVQELFKVPRAYRKLEDLVSDSEVDAVMVVTPPQFHLEAVEAAARAGKHVYCEKPMAPTVKDANAMVEACKENNVKLMIAFMKRANPSFQKAKRLIDEGRIGQVFEMRATWDNVRVDSKVDEEEEDYRLTLASGGGFLQEDGSHPLDICRWWLGDVAEVSAEVLIAAPELHPTEDVASVLMRHRDGAVSTLHITIEESPAELAILARAGQFL